MSNKLIREYIKESFKDSSKGDVEETDDHRWEVSNRKNMMLDKEGMEQSDKDNQEKYLKSMGLMESVLEKILLEDAMGFVHALAASDKFDDQFFGGEIDKAAGRDIKRAFEKHADHQWLKTIDTVHWTADAYNLSSMVGKGKDELSTTMALPGDPLRPISFLPLGLWIKGRITLATDTQDTLYSGKQSDYDAPKEGSEEEVTHRDKSSGRNKRPTMSKSYKNYGKLERGNEYMEKMANNIPYVLDQSTWNPNNPSSTNEALVDNWRPHAIVIASSEFVEIIGADALSNEAALEQSAGAVKEVYRSAIKMGVPIVNTSRKELWRPDNV